MCTIQHVNGRSLSGNGSHAGEVVLCLGFVEQTPHEHMSDEYKNQYIIGTLVVPILGMIPNTGDSTIESLQPFPLLNLEDSENVALDRFLSSLLNIVQIFYGQCISNKKCISSKPTRSIFISQRLFAASFLLLDSKHFGKLFVL